MPALTGRARLAVAASCLIGTACFSGAVSNLAWYAFVLPSSLIGSATAMLFPNRGQQRRTATWGLVVVLGWAEVANVATGATNGPAARSSTVAGAAATLAAALAASPAAATFLIPLAGTVVGAVLLGAAGKVRIVATLTAGAAVISLAIVETSHRRTALVAATRRTRRWSVGVVAVAVAAVTVVAAVEQARHDPHPPHAALVANQIHAKPPWSDPFPAPSRHHAPPRDRASVPRTQATITTPHHRNDDWILLISLLGVIAVLCALAVGRILIAARSWRRLHRRLRFGASQEGPLNAWTWTLLRLAAYRRGIPVSHSPDVVVDGEADYGLPPDAAEALKALAILASHCAFSPDPAAEEIDIESAWRRSDDVCAAVESGLPRSTRWLLRFRGPGVATVGIVG